MCLVIVRKKGRFSRCFPLRPALFLSGRTKFKSSPDFVLYSDLTSLAVLSAVIMNLKMAAITAVVSFADKYTPNVNSKELKRSVIQEFQNWPLCVRVNTSPDLTEGNVHITQF